MSDKNAIPQAPAAPFVETGIPTSRVHADIAALTHQGARENNEDAYVVYRLGRFMERIASNLPESDLPGAATNRSYAGSQDTSPDPFIRLTTAETLTRSIPEENVATGA